MASNHTADDGPESSKGAFRNPCYEPISFIRSNLCADWHHLPLLELVTDLSCRDFAVWAVAVPEFEWVGQMKKGAIVSDTFLLSLVSSCAAIHTPGVNLKLSNTTVQATRTTFKARWAIIVPAHPCHFCSDSFPYLFGHKMAVLSLLRLGEGVRKLFTEPRVVWSAHFLPDLHSTCQVCTIIYISSPFWEFHSRS